MQITFDIETIPDLDGGKLLYGIENVKPEEMAKAMLAERRRKSPDADYLPLHQLKVIAISVAVRWDSNKFLVTSLGKPDSSEKELVTSFFDAVKRHPVLISWNGSGFDLPVLQYRALFHAIQSQPYWDTGQFDTSLRYNNYHNRYRQRHIDLMDVLSRYQGRGWAALDEVSKLMHLPGKIGIGGENVFEAYLDNRLPEIRQYCEIDTLNTYLIFLRFEYIRGAFTLEEYEKELQIVRSWLTTSDQSHFQEYEANWIKEI